MALEITDEVVTGKPETLDDARDEDGAEERDWEELELSVVRGEEEMDVKLLMTLVVELAG